MPAPKAFDRTLTVSGTASLDVTTGSGDITIKAGSADKVVVHGTIHSNNDGFCGAENAVHSVESNPPIQQNGNSIRIGYDLPESMRRRVSISYEDRRASRYHGTGSQRLAESRIKGVPRRSPAPDRLRRDPGAGSRRTLMCRPEAEASGRRNVAAPFSAHTGSGDIRSRSHRLG